MPSSVIALGPGVMEPVTVRFPRPGMYDNKNDHGSHRYRDFKTGDAGYVAMETVTGTLDGHTGTFQLMQIATMEAGKPDLRCLVVPGSGTGALQGLAGTFTLDPSGGKHTYTMDYTLPSAP